MTRGPTAGCLAFWPPIQCGLRTLWLSSEAVRRDAVREHVTVPVFLFPESVDTTVTRAIGHIWCTAKQEADFDDETLLHELLHDHQQALLQDSRVVLIVKSSN